MVVHKNMTPQKFKKKRIEATVKFVQKNVPTVDEVTLDKFMELIYTGGKFGSIEVKRMIDNMEQLLEHVPGSCKYSLYAVAAMLGIQISFSEDNRNGNGNGPVH